MDANIALVAVTLIGIVVPVLKWWDDRRARKEVAAQAVLVVKVAEQAAERVAEVKVALGAANENTNTQLKEIHTLVNSRLTKAIELAGALMTILRDVAPNDQRVKDIAREVDKS